MRLLIQSLMIFFGTLMAAGLLALGEPHSRGPAGQQLSGVDTAGAMRLARSPAEPVAPAPSAR